jgi:hypothetical protein
MYLLGSPSSETPPAVGGHPVSRAARPDLPTLPLAVAAAVPLIWFAGEIGGAAGLNHWPMQGALPLAILATAGLTALRQTE